MEPVSREGARGGGVMGAVGANLIVVAALLAALAHLAAHDPKPVEILRLRQVAIAPADVGFEVRLQPAADDREQWALLCNLEDGEPCGVAHHERWSQRDVEGQAAPRLWRPVPWHHVDAGEYLVVAGVGPRGQVRAHASARLSIR